MKNILGIFFIVFIISCNKINKKDLQGNWRCLSISNKSILFEEMHFKNDTIEILDEYFFKHIGAYEIKNNNLLIQLNSGAKIEQPIMAMVGVGG